MNTTATTATTGSSRWQRMTPAEILADMKALLDNIPPVPTSSSEAIAQWMRDNGTPHEDGWVLLLPETPGTLTVALPPFARTHPLAVSAVVIRGANFRRTP